MNKKKTIKRLTASGALLVTLSPMAQTLVGVGEGVAHALKPSSEYPQTQFEADLAAYQTAKAQYDRDKAAYDAEKAKYDTDLTAYNAGNTNYQQALAKYQRDKAAYDQKMAEYQAALQQAAANTGVDGWLSQAVAQGLVFKSEPNAELSISGGAGYYQAPDADRYGNAPNKGYMNYRPDQPDNGSIVSSMTDPIILHISDDLESYPVVLNPGQTVTATYTNISNSYYVDQQITQVLKLSTL